MANVFVTIGKDAEIVAKDFLGLLEKAKTEAEVMASPKALLALTVLLEAVAQAVLVSAAAAADDGLNFSLDATAAQLIIKCLPDAKAYLKAISQSKG
jgi:hypothetical protein